LPAPHPRCYDAVSLESHAMNRNQPTTARSAFGAAWLSVLGSVGMGKRSPRIAAARI
jgi:hypothetical protein